MLLLYHKMETNHWWNVLLLLVAHRVPTNFQNHCPHIFNTISTLMKSFNTINYLHFSKILFIKKKKFFFDCNLLDWPICFEPLNSPLAQCAEELGRW